MKAKKKTLFEARLHVALAGLWTLLLIPTILWWKESILWVLVISVYANIAGHWSGYQAARADLNSPDA